MSSPTEPENFAEAINHAGGEGWNQAMGLVFSIATVDEVVASWTVDAHHRQPYGIVHGGVYCGVIEALCSTGAAISAMATTGYSVVGLENSTSFLRAVRSGTLTGRATPVHCGRRSQVWEATIRDEQGRPVASGRVRLMCLEPDAPLAGQSVGLSTGERLKPGSVDD
ncbi:MAG: PaaI family thioesterase [Polyangiaceae bacterium]|nr:PaaI family thioesterase [Myxococcales bacterium]MCB9587406.1 PaaI family thioesterase [Polyangiaceae bacterium]MCB9605797.1 PaaI family thioesterase [Polyangiaceae bacterium]